MDPRSAWGMPTVSMLFDNPPIWYSGFKRIPNVFCLARFRLLHPRKATSAATSTTRTTPTEMPTVSPSGGDDDDLLDSEVGAVDVCCSLGREVVDGGVVDATGSMGSVDAVGEL